MLETHVRGFFRRFLYGLTYIKSCRESRVRGFLCSKSKFETTLWGFCGYGMIGQRQHVRVIVLDFGTVYASSRSLVHSQAWMYVQISQLVSVHYRISFKTLVS